MARRIGGTSVGSWLIPRVRGLVALREREASGEFNFLGNRNSQHYERSCIDPYAK